jgi:hypothetical protein
MTDINGRQPKDGDIVCMAFRRGNSAQLRKGRVVEIYPGDTTKPRYSSDYATRAKIQWLASSHLGLPESTATTVQLRDYVILS